MRGEEPALTGFDEHRDRAAPIVIEEPRPGLDHGLDADGARGEPVLRLDRFEREDEGADDDLEEAVP